jgi:iron complex outermembrane receptor protein
MKTKITLLISFLLLSFTMMAQYKITGTVSDSDGQPLPGVTVVVKGGKSGTTTDFDGKYSLNVNEGDLVVFSSVGFNTIEKTMDGSTSLDITMSEGMALDEIVVVGSRNPNRTAVDTAVPVDVIDIKELVESAPQVNLNQILNYVAPSFTSSTQSVSDGTDHIDPASLRGLGPDQVLVLINGKRRHSTSLVNVNSTVGRGSVGTDLNAIPVASIKRVEVLRDGAAAQYGSDAIAGVINIVLKTQTKGLDVTIDTGANFSSEGNNQDGGTDGEKYQVDVNYGLPIGDNGGFINFTGSLSNRDRTFRAGKDGFSGSVFNAYNAIENVANNSGFDLVDLQTDFAAIQNFATQVGHFSTQLQTDISNANNIGDLQSILNADVTDSELAARGQTRSDYSMKVGQSELREGKFFANMSIPISDDAEIYSFGGLSFRKGQAAGFYRRPDQSRANTTVFINGFLPEIASDIVDKSLVVGIKGKKGEWDVDFSNTYGVNSFDFNIVNTSNATLGRSTPQEFYAGGFSFMQNTTNLDINRFYEDTFEGLNVAFGAEYRLENYQLLAGQEESYASYNTNGNVHNPADPNSIAVTDFFGRTRPGGSQVFPGFRPANERDRFRSSLAAYVDLEADISESFLLNTALRFEDYSDFGNTFNWKIATRLKVGDNFNIRAAISTGFRAPSLHQLHFNATSTNFVNGIPVEVGTFSNDSRIAQLLGISQLKEEESFSGSLGFTAKIPKYNVTITIDGFYTKIDDRVILTDNFSRPSTPTTAAEVELQGLFDQANATKARFFANAIDTKTTGIDVVIDHHMNILGFKMKESFALSYSKTEQDGSIHASDQLAAAGLTDTYFSNRSKLFLEEAQPRLKVVYSANFVKNKFNIFFRNTMFGEVTNPNQTDADFDGTRETNPVHGSIIVTDLSLGYKVSETTKISIGANNILDQYPDLVAADLTSGNNFIYPRATSQFGMNGRYMFARLSFTLK